MVSAGSTALEKKRKDEEKETSFLWDHDQVPSVVVVPFGIEMGPTRRYT